MHQPTLFSPQPPDESVQDSDQDSRPGSVRDGLSGSPLRLAPSPSRAAIWLRRLELIVRIVVRLYLGLIVLGLPWTRLWDDNRFLTLYPRLADLATTGVARGLVSGLGLLNIWIAISDAIHYRDYRDYRDRRESDASRP